MKQVMHAPTRGIHNMAAALRSRMRWSSSLALSGAGGVRCRSLVVERAGDEQQRHRCDKRACDQRQPDGRGGKRLGREMDDCCRHDAPCAVETANSPVRAARTPSPTPWRAWQVPLERQAEHGGSANGSVSCVYSGSMNCTPMATQAGACHQRRRAGEVGRASICALGQHGQRGEHDARARQPPAGVHREGVQRGRRARSVLRKEADRIEEDGEQQSRAQQRGLERDGRRRPPASSRVVARFPCPPCNASAFSLVDSANHQIQL